MSTDPETAPRLSVDHDELAVTACGKDAMTIGVNRQSMGLLCGPRRPLADNLVGRGIDDGHDVPVLDIEVDPIGSLIVNHELRDPGGW
jgi:hypothetical protein